MGVTNYYSVDGEMVGDYDGVDHRDYLRDAIGSVTRITGGTAQRYKPFGQDRVVDLHLPRPRFGWIGVYGYEATYLWYSHHYVKTRHYDPNIARWTTVDPLWPSEPAYSYAGNNPTNWIDPSGKYWIIIDKSCLGHSNPSNKKTDKERIFSMLVNYLGGGASSGVYPNWDCLLRCLDDVAPDIAKCLRKHRDAKSGTATVKFICGNTSLCRSNPKRCAVGVPRSKTIYLCPRAFKDPKCWPLDDTIAHELMHECGTIHGSYHTTDRAAHDCLRGCWKDPTYACSNSGLRVA
ncbi:MAG: hypothetical protein H7Y17_16250 [Chlorobia bacterium]|nr:hypothetical protein [Fimbriimonadaceae bacterium]